MLDLIYRCFYCSHLTCFAATSLQNALHCTVSTRNISWLARPILLNANTIKGHRIKKQSLHASHPEPTGGWKLMWDHCVASVLCDTLQTQLSLCSLTFPLNCCSSQLNAIINKDHKQVMAFIPPKFMVQKRSFCGWQFWLLFGRYLPHSPATRQWHVGDIVLTELNVHHWFSVLETFSKIW